MFPRRGIDFPCARRRFCKIEARGILPRAFAFIRCRPSLCRAFPAAFRRSRPCRVSSPDWKIILTIESPAAGDA